MRIKLALVLLAAAVASVQAAPTVTRYGIFEEGGKRMGEQVVERGDDGLVKVRYQYKSNGRGPDYTEQFRLAPDGTLQQYSVKGNSTFGAVVDETFERRGDQASWSSTTEKGGKTVSGSAMYVPLAGSFELASVSLAAFAVRNGASLPLLPSGTLVQRVLEKVEVRKGDQVQTVELVAETGLGLSPFFVWSTGGKTPRMFAFIAPGHMSVAEEGWEGSVKLLAERQLAAESKLLVELAGSLQHPLSGLTVVRNVRVFDSDKAVLGAPSDIHILRGRITAVLPAGSPVRGAEQEIDAGGRVALPGLFDMHGHIGRWEAGLHLAAGVTTVRDMGNDNATVQKIIDETAAGKLLAPQVVPTGFLEGVSPYSAAHGFTVKDLAGARNAIDWYAQHGYPQLKIYNSFPPAILKDTVAYAHQRGLRVSGHIPAGLRAEQALDAGYDEIQHINQLMLNFLATPTTETRTLERFVLPAEKVAGLDFDSPRVRRFIARLKKQGTVVDPTLATFAFLKQADGDMNEPFAAIADHMPPDVKRGFHIGTMKIPDAATRQRYEKSFAKMIDFVGRLYKAGVPIVAGTDELAGFTLQAELEMLVKAGLAPAQALQVATRNGALYTRTSHERGSIVAGKLADLVLVDGDPTAHIGDIRKVAAVITRGMLVYPHEIDQALGIVPFVKNPPLLRTRVPVSSKDALDIAK